MATCLITEHSNCQALRNGRGLSLGVGELVIQFTSPFLVFALFLPIYYSEITLPVQFKTQQTCTSLRGVAQVMKLRGLRHVTTTEGNSNV